MSETANLELPILDLPDVNKARQSDDDFIGDLITVANEVNKSIVVLSGIIPQKEINSEKLEVLIGHLVRIYKLYDSYLFLMVEMRTEIVYILSRTIAETIINFEYIIKHLDTDIINKYKRAALAHDKKLEELILKRISDKTTALPIEDRMLESIKETAKRSGLGTLDDIELKKTKWGLNEEQLEILGKAKDVDLEMIYNTIFASSSEFIHGSWHDLDFHHLMREKDERGIRSANYHYTRPRPQLMETISILILKTLKKYLRIITLEETQDAKQIETYLNKLIDWFYQMVTKHEEFIANKK